ncbi:MAG: SMP-30/gluconolactonase/LRE family protein [Gammaproteobacteria bacterium]|nr:SMP-30/gluconolactonase/LRE family protein [Gammaproteobacteria bacterium]NNM14974.1 SMP-30/gluconolactonase/LRE family protein [Gammaproteobacteria bacterium]
MHLTKHIALIKSLTVQNTLGEGIQWNSASGEICWTDIIDKKLYTYQPETGDLNAKIMPQAVCSFAFIANTDLMLIAFDTGIATYDPQNEQLAWLYADLCDGVTERLNDGRVDRQGRFWVGSMMLRSVDEDNPASGKLYCLDSDGELHVRETGMHISNGLSWSPDGHTMYFADSPRREIYAYDFDVTSGNLSHKRIFINTPPNTYPDGACVDADGFLWSAHWGASQVVRYSPDGNIDCVVKTPASQPSCPAFAGINLDILCVTSARQDLQAEQLNEQPRAGDVFLYQTDIRGISEQQYQAEI